MIELTGLKKYYGRRCVLDLPALSLEECKKYALVGPNGSGKSTLLRIMSGTLKADDGVVSMPEELLKDRGSMPQHPYIYDFSVLKNVMMALQGLADAEAMARGALAKLGLSAMEKSNGRGLSGGEAQRTAFARMIARPRKLLLLDEATSAMDVAGGNLVESALRDYCSRWRCTLIFATHSLAQAQRLADEILFLHEGRLAERATPEDFFCAAKSALARDFLEHWQIAGPWKGSTL